LKQNALNKLKHNLFHFILIQPFLGKTIRSLTNPSI